MYQINSPALKNILAIKQFWENIHISPSFHLQKNFINKFPWYYVFSVDASIVEYVYYDCFFKSQEYFEACEKKLFSRKWEEYIKTRKQWNLYILDAHDYNGEILRYFINHPREKFSIDFFWSTFWWYHDLGHIYLHHIYTKWTFKHKDEMDASIFSVIKLLTLSQYKEKEVISEVYTAIYPLLKTWKYINKEDFKYFLFWMNYYKNLLPSSYDFSRL